MYIHLDNCTILLREPDPCTKFLCVTEVLPEGLVTCSLSLLEQATFSGVQLPRPRLHANCPMYKNKPEVKFFPSFDLVCSVILLIVRNQVFTSANCVSLKI